MKLLVIIVTYNGIKWIDKCLKSVKESTIDSDIIIIDNGSTDGTQEYINNYFPDTIFVQSKENLGFGKANNIGLQYALDNEYDFVYLLNQDAWVYKNTFEILINGFKSNKKFGILSPIQYQSNGKHLDLSFQKCINSSDILLSICVNTLLNNDMSLPIKVNMTMAAHWMISKECLSIVGGFSPSFPHYGEDNNYNDRIRYWGFNMGIIPAAKAIHDREKRTESITKIKYMYKMGEIGYLSNPNKRRKPWLLNFLSNIKFFISEYRDFAYILTFFYIINNINSIIKYKKISKSRCAFLNEK